MYHIVEIKDIACCARPKNSVTKFNNIDLVKSDFVVGGALCEDRFDSVTALPEQSTQDLERM